MQVSLTKYSFLSALISQSLLDTCRGLDPVDRELPVLVPGDRGRAREQEVERRGGVRYKEEQINNMMELARELEVTPPHVLSHLVN